MVCPQVERTNENKRYGRESAHRNPRPPTQGHQGKFVEVHWDTRVCCELRQVISRRSRTPTRTLHGRTCVQPEMDQAIYLGKNKVAPWSGAHPVNQDRSWTPLPTRRSTFQGCTCTKTDGTKSKETATRGQQQDHTRGRQARKNRRRAGKRN